jgi:DNA-directed RNA polymerase subunit RPC12/RpoP
LQQDANLESHEPDFQWEEAQNQTWTESEQAQLRSYSCPACGGEIITEETTAATFCPYCENPTILPAQVSGGLKPDGVLPFRKSKADAEEAFRNLCKGKPLLPRFFREEHRVEKITGIYVPFWLYDCQGDFYGNYKATRIHTWSDRDYIYTRTNHYHLVRAADSEFVSIPMDASKKMDNAIMESIEPYDYSQIVDFETAYLSGFLADKYDVESSEGQERVKERVASSINSMISGTIAGYQSVIPISTRLNVKHGKAKYVLLPVWMLNSNYKGKIYTFLMNGQTGKIAGSLPVCPRQSAKWFAGICAGVTAAATLVQLLLV